MVGLDYAQGIRAAQVRLLYEQVPSALTATAVNPAVLIAVLWKQVSHAFLLGWLLVILLVAFGRYVQRRAYLRNHSVTESIRWGRNYLYGVAANGMLWGFAGFFFFTAHSYVHQV